MGIDKTSETKLRTFLEEMNKKYFADINISSFIKKYKENEKKSEKHERQYKKLVKDYCSKLEKNRNKKFEVSPKFYNAALQELKKSFRYGEEMGMLIFFREHNGNFYGDEFYTSSQVIKKDYGYSTPLKMQIKAPNYEYIILGSFAFNIEKIYELANNSNKLIIPCHTHPRIATPSKGDLRENPFSGIIIGFERTSDRLEKLVHETFKKPQWKEEISKEKDYKKPPNISDEKWQEYLNNIVGKKVRRRIFFDFSDEFYNNILEECSPKVNLFYTNNKNTLKKIPLYVNGEELK